jgi:hypothetical protein
MMLKAGALVLLAGAVAACGAHGDSTERYAVGTYLYSGSILFGSTGCEFSAPPGVLDGTLIKAPGTIKETCPKGNTSTIIADYADHIVLTFPKTAKVGEEVYLSFELRDAQNRQLTPTLSEEGVTTLDPSCAALTDLDRHGAQDTGRDPFMNAKASAAGQCKVSIDIELPTAGGATKKHHAEQVVVVK